MGSLVYKYLDNSINIKLDSITCIIGGNASGKSTLALNFYKSINKSEYKVYYMPQSFDDELYQLNVYDEIKRVFNKDIEEDKIKKYINNSIKIVDLNPNYLEYDPNELDELNLRKMNIVKMFLSNSDILILDEPTLSLNEIDRDNFIKIIKRFKRDYNKTIVISTNDIELVNLIADDIILLNKDKSILQLTNQELFNNIEYIDNSGINIPNTILFSELAHKNKGIKYRPRNDINDLIKDILRNIDLSNKGGLK